MMEVFMGFEADIIRWLQSFSCASLDYFMSFFSFLSDFLIIILFFIILLHFKEKMLAIYFVIAELFSALVQTILKLIIKRPRPYVQYDDIRGIFNASGTSFPSGHSITAMCVVVFCIFLIIKNKPSIHDKVLLFSFCVLYLIWNMFNRMYLGQHFLTDVLAGYVISAILGVVYYILLPKFEKFYEKIASSLYTYKQSKTNEN